MQNKELILENKAGNFSEVFAIYDPDSFKYEYEKNGDRFITFTAIKIEGTEDIFDMLVNENYIIYQGQYYVIKSTSLAYNAQVTTCEVEAKHIFMNFQNHYIEKEIEDEELNAETGDEDTAPNYTLEQFLDFGFAKNKLGFEYEIIGENRRLAPVSELGNKNGLEFITEGAEYFNYIYFADNKKIYFYTPDLFYEYADFPIVYRGNSDDVKLDITTTDLKTIIQGYGKKKTKSETKNYNPIKPKDLSYSGTFDKTGTWTTEKIGASYSKTFTCKWGNETLTWTRKKGSKGGVVDVYLDDKKMNTFELYRKTAKTDTVTIAKNLSKGKHTFKVIFRGGQSGVDYKKKAPVMYVGAEKTTVLNLIAVLKGKDVYHTYGEYKSPNYDVFGEMRAPTVFDEKYTNKTDLIEALKEQLNDEPTVELSTNYLINGDDIVFIGEDDVKENNIVRFIHKPLNFNTDLKVVKLTRYHPLTQKPVDIEFSNAKLDIVDIQTRANQRIRRANSAIAQGNWNVNNNQSYDLYSDVMGSVLVDD
ncbi:prophage endopeptidase tail family protein [Staphylococcus gallinarum]|uniref:prophage endopeptidase tail family protein n=1 Tax=Staphylococcus gallinarum TaxID=1293 RepID=UPI000D1C2518|nr:prophage endopeptidase tail family protein [Staphylococcus gallinarum]PTE79308.1 peptidase [Staphylococcus gallinarum]